MRHRARAWPRQPARRPGSIGLGTYLGDPTAEADGSYHRGVVAVLESGVNVPDTATSAASASTGTHEPLGTEALDAVFE